ncbi:hypothetical protein VTN31DRAFT_4821 [Thermomyces dupontii]|uniref:uncharacterized protein n=1 Tax=Talaromyces thermophilus TaxID=28565 RepID=UPI003742C241
MSPNSNQLTFVLQESTYRKTERDLLNSVAAALAGWVAGPFLITPLAAVVGRSSVVLWSLVGVFMCQIWAAKMTGPDDYIPFVMSRWICALFGSIPAILGSGYIVDMFFLHQRGKAFAVFEILIVFAVVGGGTLSGFIAESLHWSYVFWWTLGPVGAAILAVFLFVEDTSFDGRRGGATDQPALPDSWLERHIATFFPGHRTQGRGRTAQFVSQSKLKKEPH